MSGSVAVYGWRLDAEHAIVMALGLGCLALCMLIDVQRGMRVRRVAAAALSVGHPLLCMATQAPPQPMGRAAHASINSGAEARGG
jgi:uncharacterized membrane protein|eukprot:COSAG01_NODE_498_length_16259_cov_11.917512_27_plen_85_part_00